LYSIAGRGVKVGSGVLVEVGVGLCSKVGEGLAVPVGSGGATCPVPRSTRKINPPPMAKTTNSRPSASGKLRRSSGRRCERTALGLLAEGFAEKVRPHTKQRVAFSGSLVPQVGQSIKEEDLLLEFIIWSFPYGFESRIIIPLALSRQSG
jgi:hypothetical protein